MRVRPADVYDRVMAEYAPASLNDDVVLFAAAVFGAMFQFAQQYSRL